jgi:ELWxxDGT repeat protein
VLRRNIFLALIGSLVAWSALAATPYLVKDINQQLSGAGSYPEHYLSIGGVAVFTTTDGNGHALELWRTDGTGAGTFKLTTAPDEMVVWSSKLWFLAAGSLWSTDGTVAGTQKLTLPAASPALVPSHLMAGTAYLYFFDRGMLWRTNGTTAGTTRVGTLVMTPGRSATDPDRPWSASVGPTLFFLAHTDSLGLELWKVTDSGTLTELFDLTSNEATYVQAAGTLVYLQVKHESTGISLYRSDGTTAGTVPLLNSPLLPTGDPIHVDGFMKLVTAGSLVYFTGSDATGIKLWRSDGTRAGTVSVASSLPGALAYFGARPIARLPNGTILSYGAVLPGSTGTGLWAFNGTTTTFLAAMPLTSRPVEANLAGNVAIIGCGDHLWRSDGTIGGTYDLGLTDGSYGQRSWPGITLGTSVIFSAFGDGHGVEPWKTDGSMANTVLVKDVIAGTAGANVKRLVPLRGGVLFEAASVITNNQYIPELWSSNGTAAGTQKLLDNQSARGVTTCGNRAYFRRFSTDTGVEPWITDGTAAGTALLKDLFPGRESVELANDSAPDSFTCVDGTMFFQASGANGIDLWRSNGTAAGTFKVRSFGAGVGDGSFLYGLQAALGHQLILLAIKGSNTMLWRSDGTEAGTVLIGELQDSGWPWEIMTVGNYTYFVSGSGREKQLRRTDGTLAGTMILQYGGFHLGTDFHGRMTYSMGDGWPLALCTTDGSTPGTCVTVSGPSAAGLVAFGLLPLNGRLYYNTPRLRSTDGATETIGDIQLASQLLGTAGGRMFLNGEIDPSRTSTRLLRSDGTLAGTEVLMDSPANEAVSSGGRAYLALDELYALDLEVTPTGFSPASVAAPGGQTVTIAGRGFLAPVTIRVGGINATVGTVTATSITFTAPTHDAGTYDIDLTLGDGRRMTLDAPLAYSCAATAVIAATPPPICPLTTVILQGSGGTRCSWFPAEGLDDASSCSPKATVSVTTTYRLMVFTANGCPSANFPAVTVTVNTPPLAIITVADAVNDVVRTSTTYTAAVPDAGLGATYVWTITGATVTAGQGTRTVSFRVACGQTPHLEVVMTSATGCTVSGQKDLVLDPPRLLSVSPGVANPGTLMTITGSSLECVSALGWRGLDDAGFEVVGPISHTVVNSTTAQYRFSGNAVRITSLYSPGVYYEVAAVTVRRAPPRDFNGDLRSDVFWRNSTTGETSVWNINGATFTGLASTPVPSPWVPGVFGDFSGDGRADMLWYNTATGETSIWLMNGVKPSTTVRSIRVPVTWKPAGTGDFNGDGKADIFWTCPSTGETSIWFMDGTVVTTAVRSLNVPVGWRPAGFGDLNADGKCDIVWWRPASGETSYWLMNGTGTPGTAVRGETLAGWTLAGCGDFNADRKDDLLWHNPATGATLIWRMNGVALLTKAVGVTVPLGFVPAAIGNFDANSAADVFWHNPSTGETSVWLRTVGNTVAPSPLLRVKDLNWKPVIVP